MIIKPRSPEDMDAYNDYKAEEQRERQLEEMFEKKKMLSVIIPVYNEARFLDRCLKSLKPNPDVEIIVIDDGSTDNSAEIIEKYKDKLDVVEILPNNAGVSFARNIGLTVATGKYVTFLDADDQMAPEGLENMLKAIYRFYGAINVIQLNHYRMKDNEARLMSIYSARCGFYTLDELPPKWAPVWNKLYERAFLEEHGIKFPYKQQFDEDRQFNLACLKYTGGLQCVETVGIIKHFDNSASLCHTFDRKKATDALAALVELLKEKNAPDFDNLVRKCLLMHLNSEKFKRELGGGAE